MASGNLGWGDGGDLQLGGGLVLEQMLDHHAPRDHGQVGRQIAFALEAAQHREVVLDQGQKDFGAEVFAVFRREPDGAGLRRMVDDVDHQAHESIDEVLPRPRLAVQAAVEQLAVDF